MQLLQVLRGCLGAYAAGVLLYSALIALYVWQRTPAVFSAGRNFMMGVVYGGAMALPIVLAVILLWIVLAWKKVTVTWPVALIAGAFLTGLASIPLSHNLNGVVAFALIGMLFGAVFWGTAFGRTTRVRLSFN
ncbi:MAG: hypothetical protein CML66_16385 [Rhodobacteraceae bacterium]|nr:hypothetical protein [Paracoccaceae bacterium]MAY44852.1 hypothetical protein [Paracoccaceae bacterium]QEW18088.1 hypothetical protein LA6_000246 [Marinibacterium anthonyi]